MFEAKIYQYILNLDDTMFLLARWLLGNNDYNVTSDIEPLGFSAVPVCLFVFSTPDCVGGVRNYRSKQTHTDTDFMYYSKINRNQ